MVNTADPTHGVKWWPVSAPWTLDPDPRLDTRPLILADPRAYKRPIRSIDRSPSSSTSSQLIFPTHLPSRRSFLPLFLSPFFLYLYMSRFLNVFTHALPFSHWVFQRQAWGFSVSCYNIPLRAFYMYVVVPLPPAAILLPAEQWDRLKPRIPSVSAQGWCGVWESWLLALTLASSKPSTLRWTGVWSGHRGLSPKGKANPTNEH